MSSTISDEQIRVYKYAKSQGLVHFSVSELARAAGIRESSAYNHASRFVELGIFDCWRQYPQQVFRLSAYADQRSPEMVRRLEEHLPIVDCQREKRVKSEAAANQRMKKWPGSSGLHAKPNGRRRSDQP